MKYYKPFDTFGDVQTTKRVAILVRNCAYHQDVLNGITSRLAQESRVYFDLRIYFAKDTDIEDKNTAEAAILTGPDLLIAIGAGLAQTAKSILQKRSSRIPLVFAGAAGPVGLGLVQSLERPGCNVTGTNMVPEDKTIGIRLLLQLLPWVKKIVLPYCPYSSNVDIEVGANAIKAYGEFCGVDVRLLPIQNPESEGIGLIKSLLTEADVIMTLPSCTMTVIASGLAKLASDHNIIFFAGDSPESALKLGIPFAFGPRSEETGKYAAEQVKKILIDGVPASEIPVQYVTRGCKFVANIDAIREQQITVDEDLLLLISRGQVVNKHGDKW